MLDATLKLPGIREHHVRYNKHLLDRYVPDVHGVQVLTERHLAGLGDTTGWEVTGLSESRFLVQADDLEPWYAGPAPDPATLDAAREQFAGVLLTADVIRANPTPW